MKKLITHNGAFHTDDVLAYAILLKHFRKNNQDIEIVRTRDMEIIKTGDVVFDVGDSYDPNTHRYDHHQVGRAGERDNTIPYAACGLVWKHFGPDLCSSEQVWKIVDEKLVQSVDAGDNGVATYTLNSLNVKSFSLGDVINCFKPIEEDASLDLFDAQFVKAGEFMLFILNSVISSAERKIEDMKNAEIVYNNSEDKQLIICEKHIPGIKKLLSIFPEPVFVIYPDQNNKWRVEGVRINPDDFPIRKDLPERWAGLRDGDLQKVSGVSDATFCHPGLFTAGAVSKEGAIKLAKKALEA